MRISILAALYLLAAGLSSSNAQASDSLTVEQAVNMTLESHPAIQQALQGVGAARARVSQSRSGLYPNIGGEGLYARIGPVPKITLPDRGALALYPEDNYDVHVGISQTVYDFGRRSRGIDLARSYQQTASDKVDLVKMNLAYQTIAVFNAILFLRQNIAVLDEQVDALSEHLQVAQKKVQAGTATDFDVLTTRVKVDEVRSQRIDVANVLTKQEIAFRELTGLQEDTPVQLKGSFSVTQVDLNADSLVSAALNSLPEMKLSRNAEASASIQYRLASLGDRPSLNVNLQYGFKNGYYPNLNTWEANWVAGLQIQTPIFNGHRTRSQKQEAMANLNSARSNTSDIERRINADVRQAVADVQASLEKLKTSETQVERARDAVSMARVRYDAGVITNLDLIDAQTSLSYAELVHLKALYDFVNSRYALDKVVGGRSW